MHRCLILLVAFCSVATAATAATNQVWLDERFELRPGFRIYRAASGELSGGSYALTFDGQGRLLVGDGNAVRRLVDTNYDGVFDGFEVIASGLGPRGPQGLLVYGDDLYAVGGDGLQRFSGYQSGGTLRHRGRLGNKLGTGGDHDAHSLVRGHDGWIYLMAGNGSGLTNRQHITENSSPALFEREASVFRISPDGARWECVASGGRNPPSLGQNYVGDWFSFDSDMEWHVGLPWYRPVRLNHWLLGGDQGWQEVGAYPSYFIDSLPGILEVGRGSPNWGVFYEHTLFPESYLNAFLVCDYRWKRESDDRYATTGRLVAFFPRRQAGRWDATMETVVRPRPDARDLDGHPIQFALVDVAVAPDGSLLLSDHNQGIWRLCYLPGTAPDSSPPALTTPWLEPGRAAGQSLDALLTLPQPGSERTRLREVELMQRLGKDPGSVLRHAARNPERPLAQRLRAVRLLSPEFARLPMDFVKALALDPAWELRAQAASLLGWRGGEESVPRLLRMLDDRDPFIRRRAVEALARVGSASATSKLLALLEDPERSVRYAAMIALSHRPTQEWFFQPRIQLQTQLRILTASYLRKEPAAPEQTKDVFRWLLPRGAIGSGWTNPEPRGVTDSAPASHLPPPRRYPAPPAAPPITFASREDRLDLLRVLDLFRETISSDPDLLQRVHTLLLGTFPDAERDVRWEQARLLGAYKISQAFPALLRTLEKEQEPVTQFHLAQALATLPSGWSPEEEQRALTWFLGTQTGWFAEFSGKGVQFPEFWATVLTDFGTAHRTALLQQSARLKWTGLLGGVALNLMASSSQDGSELIQLYAQNQNHQARLRILQALRGVSSDKVGDFLQTEHERIDGHTREGAELQGAILQYWAAHPTDLNRPFLVYEGLFHDDALVVRPAARTLAGDRAALRRLLERNSAAKPNRAKSSQTELANDLIQRMEERPDLFAALEEILAGWSGETRVGFKPGLELKRRVDEATRTAALRYWREWATRQFGALPTAATAAAHANTQKLKSDGDLHRFLLSDAVRGGNSSRGATVYETLQCQTCHGGGIASGREGRLFGPDLAGVTRRLTRPELADSLIYPSKQVADRFKAIELTLKDGTSITGFVTEQTADSITIADREQVRKLSRSTVQSVAPLSTSLMPETLLNRLSWDELRDLMSFLESR